MKRLHVRIPESELRHLERSAKRRRVTTSAFVRLAIRDAVQRDEQLVAGRLALIRAAAGHDFPIGDIKSVVAEIERGYTT